MYLARDGRLTRLSRDQVAEGPGMAHVLGQALGLAPEVQPHTFEQPLKDGDLAMLCSDGVSNVLDETVLAEKLCRRSAAQPIVCSAREHATAETMDDMSAIVLDIENAGRFRIEKEPAVGSARPAAKRGGGGRLHSRSAFSKRRAGLAGRARGTAVRSEVPAGSRQGKARSWPTGLSKKSGTRCACKAGAFCLARSCRSGRPSDSTRWSSSRRRV